jgi:hypothetical protein
MWGTNIVLQILRDSSNPAGNGLISWLDYMVLRYNMIILLQHIPYIYCIHSMTLSNDKMQPCMHVVYK